MSSNMVTCIVLNPFKRVSVVNVVLLYVYSANLFLTVDSCQYRGVFEEADGAMPQRMKKILNI